MASLSFLSRFASADAKVCDAGACFLPVGQKMRRVVDGRGCVDF